MYIYRHENSLLVQLISRLDTLRNRSMAEVGKKSRIAIVGGGLVCEIFLFLDFGAKGK